jgi:hypothetical protein
MVPSPHPAVAAIVVSFRDRAAVARCVESLLASSYSELRVIVVDNASGDGSAAEIARRFPGCRVIANEKNPGFGGGCNAGIDAAVADGADLLLLLNQDTVVDRELVERLVAFMKDHPRAGVVGAKTLSTTRMPDGSPRRLYAGARRGVLPLIQYIPGIEEKDTETPDRPVRTDYVWGHGMMVRASAVATVGAFDPAFFMYCEDLDLCRRMEAAGYEMWCEPRALMWHDIPDGARAEQSEPWRWVCKVRSNRLFHRKHYGLAAAGVLNLLTVLVEAKRLLRSRRYTGARHLLQAYVASLVGYPRGELATRFHPERSQPVIRSSSSVDS